MNDNPFSLVDETDDSFMVQHPDGRVAPIAKEPLSKEYQEKIRALPRAEMKFEPDAPKPGQRVPFTGPKLEEPDMVSNAISGLSPFGSAEAAPNPPIQQPQEQVPQVNPVTTPQVTSQAPDMNTGYAKDLGTAYGQMKAGLYGTAEAQSAGAKQQALAQQNYQNELQTMQDMYAGRRQELDAKKAKLESEVAGEKINPHQWWDQQTGAKGVGKRVLALIGLFLGGGASARGGVNPTGAALDKLISDDIDSQKENLNTKKGLLKNMMEEYGNLSAAETASHFYMNSMVAAQLQKIASQTQSETVKKQALMGVGELNVKIADQAHTLAMQTTLQGVENRGATDAQLAMLPKDLQDQMIRVGPNMNVKARSKEDATALKESEPAITHALQMIDDMEAGLRGYKVQDGKQVPFKKIEGQALPNTMGMAHLTGAGREGVNMQRNLIAAIRDVGKSPLKISEYSDEAYLKERVPNPAQYHTDEALNALGRLKQELVGKVQTARASRLQSYNPLPVNEAFKPGFKK